jgi:hypothetical protein
MVDSKDPAVQELMQESEKTRETEGTIGHARPVPRWPEAAETALL